MGVRMARIGRTNSVSGSLGTLGLVVAVVSLAGVSMAGQAPASGAQAKAPAKPFTVSKTPDGQPDLQGVWSTASVIPLERPKDLGAKEFFTKEEAEAYEKKVLAQHEVSTPGTYGDVHYSMAQFGLEKGQSQVASSIRTSLIVGPTGRVPPMLPEAAARNAARASRSRTRCPDSCRQTTASGACSRTSSPRTSVGSSPA